MLCSFVLTWCIPRFFDILICTIVFVHSSTLTQLVHQTSTDLAVHRCAVVLTELLVMSRQVFAHVPRATGVLLVLKVCHREQWMGYKF